MGRCKGSLPAVAALAAVLALGRDALAQTATVPTENAAPTADNAVMLTIFFKHDQTRPLSELNAQLERQGFYKAFPPPGVEVEQCGGPIGRASASFSEVVTEEQVLAVAAYSA